jgi:hypothetical protein
MVQPPTQLPGSESPNEPAIHQEVLARDVAGVARQ